MLRFRQTTAAPSPTRRRRSARLAAVAAIVATTLPLVVASQSSGASTGPTISGALPRYGADVAAAVGVADLKASTHVNSDSGLALSYPKLDRLYQIYNVTAGPHAGSMVVVERELATLAMARTLIVKGRQAKMANGDAGAEWISTFDRERDWLYIGFGTSGGLSGAPAQVQGSNLPGLVGIDLRTFKHVETSYPRLQVDAGDLVEVPVGIEYDETTDTLLMLQAAAHSTAALGNVLHLAGWSGADLRKGGELPRAALRPVRSCRRDPINDNATARYLTPMMVVEAPDVAGDPAVRKPFVIFPCYATTFSVNVVLTRIERATALDPTSRQEQAIVAPAAITSWAADHQRGRMYLTNMAGETATWVYEAESNAFVGIIAMSPKGVNVSQAVSLGVDDASGRLYARSIGYGLMITAANLDPVPQADVFPSLAALGNYPILVDTKRNRILSLTGDSRGNSGAALSYQIIDVPPPVAPPPKADPDQRTMQVDEEPGRTVAQYSGNASAYGLRVLLARGASGAIPSNGNDTAGDTYKNINSYCGFTDRELVLAGVGRTELSNSSKFAIAAGADFDSATVTDLKVPSRCDIYNSYAGGFYPLTAVTPFLQTTGVLTTADSRTPDPAPELATTINTHIGPKTTWDYVPADCTKPGGNHAPGPNSSPLVGPTKVDCTKTDEITAHAEARVRELNASPVVSVARATANTKVVRDKEKGLVSTATARVEGIKIGDVSIAYIENSATSYAKGRAGTAFTEFSGPRIGPVSGPNIPPCPQCDVNTVLKNLNTLIAGRAEFRTVPPETRLKAGTPGGYEAGIIKSEKQKASDNSLSGDKSVEIPAIELVVYNDNSVIGRARQVYQFAGVRVDSHYGVQAASADTGCLSCDLPIGTTIDELGEVFGGLDFTPLSPTGFGPPAVTAAPRGIPRVIQNIVELPKAVAEGLKVFLANPSQALAMATAWLLLGAPYLAMRRRRVLRSMMHESEGSVS